MSPIDLQKLFEGMRPQLEKDAAAGRLAGITLEDLGDAMAHPKAPEIVAETLAAEAGSVKPGETAPDFTLPWLSGAPADAGPTYTLSSRFGARPVALIFGSYT